MLAKFDPQDGLFLNFPIYEWETSIKVLRLIVKELEKTDQDISDFVNLMEAVMQHIERRQ